MSKITDAYAAAFAAATSVAELEAAIQGGPGHPFHGAPWRRISAARLAAGQRICRADPNGFYVPMIGERRKLEVCGETYGVGYGQNGPGERYVWAGAQMWATSVLKRNGISQRAAYQIWDRARAYPHRALEIVAAARAGKIKDPRFGYLHRHQRTDYGRPVEYSVAANDACTFDKRATRPCPSCTSGTLFDWGGGFDAGYEFVNWHCNGCPDVFTQYFRQGGLAKLRARPKCEAIAA